MKKAYLHLENGKVFEGLAFGAQEPSSGELIFTTGMVGCIETLTDPCHEGQIAVFTFPLIGNYGIIEEDFASSKCHMSGVVVREWCDTPSNFRSQYDLDTFLKNQGIPGIYGVDTRELSRIIRDCGSMRACITYSPDVVTDFDKTSKKCGTDFSPKAESCVEDARLSVAMINYGAPRNIQDILTARGVSATVYPQTVTAEEIISAGHNGVVLSDGAGNPADRASCIAEIAKLFGNIPVFGISLGHQLLALSAGAKVERLPHGHHGANYPVTDIFDGKTTYITSQNHDYTVIPSSVFAGKITYTNANDSSCEGIDYDNMRAFSVQFIPDEFGGPRDTGFLFDKFISLMGGEHNAD